MTLSLHKPIKPALAFSKERYTTTPEKATTNLFLTGSLLLFEILRQALNTSVLFTYSRFADLYKRDGLPPVWIKATTQ